MARIEKIYLHIGMPKTGSTSIQNFLAQNRELLQPMGFAYLRCLGKTNQMTLKFYAQDRFEMIGLREKINQRNLDIIERFNPEKFREKVLSDIKSEIAELDNNVHILVFSCELLGRMAGGKIDTIKSLLDQICNDSRIILYLRDQVDYIESSYSTSLRGENTTSLISYARQESGKHYLKYDQMIDLWSDRFGAENLSVRLFEPDAIIDRDIVKDFAHCINLPIEGLKPVSKISNRSFNQRVQKSLRLINMSLPKENNDAKLLSVKVLLGILSKADYAGESEKLDRDLYRDYVDGFSKSNEIVRQRWFPDRTLLFKDTTETRAVRLEPDEPAKVDKLFARDLIEGLLHKQFSLEHSDKPSGSRKKR